MKTFVMRSSALQDKSYAFAIRIVRMYQFLSAEKREFVLSKQTLRSGTAIGALVAESTHAHTPPDFISKLSIAAKEANETAYWLRLLKDTDYITEEMFESINADVQELLRLLISSLKTAKANLNKQQN